MIKHHLLIHKTEKLWENDEKINKNDFDNEKFRLLVKQEGKEESKVAKG